MPIRTAPPAELRTPLTELRPAQDGRAARLKPLLDQRRSTARIAGFSGGSYRTLCVRSCDGYYFPLSFATRASGFARDEAACRANGDDFSLYVHHNPGEDSGAAVSLASGQRYRDLPRAFAYRKRFDPTCEPVGSAQQIARVDAAAQAVAALSEGGNEPASGFSPADTERVGADRRHRLDRPPQGRGTGCQPAAGARRARTSARPMSGSRPASSGP
ncbi:DUF2865 domain-containing protein [Methylobrevis pamukkalensis]|uniref:DUF2865 domain-containing protein n=1 Tax=Methylobrevis pamukkalensis TaxID=1439726 RepID=A0A1E3H2P9_9HYPH|nr:DUF2865 domain-containing protein [Methylobrevis pamukkalensis]ODN70592.1 hypothetical protein A6302_02080 [Methylobrevis pamukkalensis]